MHLSFLCASILSQATAKTLTQQEEQLKKMESINALQEANKMLKIDKDKLEQELQQIQAKVMFLLHFHFSYAFYFD